ncbi:MAG TPA: DUF6327 family protein [Flavobacteriaceae bacterium]|nr:DUF6327 family protein [Flavobacteriaceae bacterium]
MSYYESIDDIDRDIEMLELKSQIEKEKIKLRFHQVKNEFSPKTIAADLVASATKSFSVLKILTSLVSGVRGRKRKRR